MFLRSISLAIVAVAAAATGCTTDVKGLNCGLLDAYVDAEGNSYCPDPAAEDDCVLVRDTMLDAFVRCGLDEATATDAAEQSFDCSSAVATKTTFDDCVSALEDSTCPVEVPTSCVGAVLTN